MPARWIEEAGKALFYQRNQFELLADDLGVAFRFHQYAAMEVELEALAGELRKRICEVYPNHLGACGVPEFAFESLTVDARLHHHHCFTGWQQEAFDDQGQIVGNRMLAWQLTLHTEPKMFSGGEVELADGTLLEPAVNRLVLYHPAQLAKVRQVECWSAHALHGRWSLTGYVYGKAEGWLESIRELVTPLPSQSTS